VAIGGANAFSYITSTSGAYIVNVVNPASGCAKVSAPVIVRVNPLPNPTIVYNQATNEFSTTQVYAPYRRYRNAQPLTGPGAYSSLYRPTLNGVYAVSVTDTNGCVNISNIKFVNTLSVKNPQAGASVKIYPNPTNGVLHVEAGVKISLVMLDVTGKVVLDARNANELNVAQLADGMYLLYISDAAGQLIWARRLLIEITS
jgi:hypothetical protein